MVQIVAPIPKKDCFERVLSQFEGVVGLKSFYKDNRITGDEGG
jgi:hypothetical protein